MKTDAELQDNVVQELRWDPQVAEPDHIGVAAADGAVTLTGHTTTYAEKLAAGRRRHRQGDRPRPGVERADPHRPRAGAGAGRLGEPGGPGGP